MPSTFGMSLLHKELEELHAYHYHSIHQFTGWLGSHSDTECWDSTFWKWGCYIAIVHDSLVDLYLVLHLLHVLSTPILSTAVLSCHFVDSNTICWTKWNVYFNAHFNIAPYMVKIIHKPSYIVCVQTSYIQACWNKYIHFPLFSPHNIFMFKCHIHHT